jgi:hypothetical protein
MDVVVSGARERVPPRTHASKFVRVADGQSLPAQFFRQSVARSCRSIAAETPDYCVLLAPRILPSPGRPWHLALPSSCARLSRSPQRPTPLTVREDGVKGPATSRVLRPSLAVACHAMVAKSASSFSINWKTKCLSNSLSTSFSTTTARTKALRSGAGSNPGSATVSTSTSHRPAGPGSTKGLVRTHDSPQHFPLRRRIGARHLCTARELE